MNIILRLAGRNIKVFLRDKISVFFSFLSVFIIIGLYALFLGDINMQNIKAMINQDNGNIRFLVDSWIMSGILVVNAITVTLGMFSVMIDDETKKRMQGFLVTPISRMKLVIGYLIASWAVGFILCMVTLVAAEIYIIAGGGALLSLTAMLKVIGLTALNVFSSSCIVFFLVSFVKSVGGFSTLSTIVGTIIGFITGIYIPIGVLPSAVQSAIKFVPPAHGAVLMREVFTEKPLSLVFGGAPAEVASHFIEIFGIQIKVYDKVLSDITMIAIVALSGLLFLALSIFRMSRRKIG